MQVKSENFTLLASIVNKAKQAVILLGKDPDLDTLLAGVFLKENLKATGKKVELVAIGKLPTEDEKILQETSSKVPLKKLLISFNWKKNAVDKVSYNMEGDNFNFIINPKNKKIEIDDIRFSYQGDDADLVVTLGENSTKIDGLEQDFFDEKTVINISKNDNGQETASLNFINPKADSICAMVCNVVEKAGISVGTETVDWIFEGLKVSTENFKNVKDPLTFEAAAFCTAVREKTPQSGFSEEVSSADLSSTDVYNRKESPN